MIWIVMVVVVLVVAAAVVLNPGKVVHTCNLSTGRKETGDPWESQAVMSWLTWVLGTEAF